MTFFIRTSVNIYGGLLRLFPKEFQAEFREEMQSVFAELVEGATRLGAFVLVRVWLFELLDMPVNLAIEHFSQWRKEWSMKDMRHGIRPFRSAEMGALGLLVGGVLMMIGAKYLVPPDWWYNLRLVNFLNMLRHFILFALAILFFGWMMGIGVGAARRTILRVIGFMVLGAAVASLFGYAIAEVLKLSDWINSLTGWREMYLASSLVSFPIDLITGAFIGCGLGFAGGGWKGSKRFILFGMLAYGSASIIWAALILGFYSWSWSTGYPGTALSFIQIIANCAYYIVAGGILGWFWGKDKRNELIRLGDVSHVN